MIDIFNLFMFALVGAYLIVIAYIVGRAIWKWFSEPFRIAYELEKELLEIENNN